LIEVIDSRVRGRRLGPYRAE